MHCSLKIAVVLMVACAVPAGAVPAFAQSNADGEIAPFIELQSGPLTPGLALDECRTPIYQVRVLVDASMQRGTLVLESNVPKFDEFGELAGGILTPQVRGERGPIPAERFACVIEFVKESGEGWRLYRLSGPKIRTPFRLATRGDLADGGPARVLVLGPDKEVKSVIECTRYGLVVPSLVVP